MGLYEGVYELVGGAECARAMNSVIATVCVSLVLLETASSVDLGAVVSHPSHSYFCLLLFLTFSFYFL